jgi:DNA-binding transcriptional MerR regulator
MRMKELEARSGINRETIRYYLREGLLPEPLRSGRNTARYTDVHLEQIAAIRRLQDERFLPLSVIRTMLQPAVSPNETHGLSLPDLEADLRQRLAQRSREPEGVEKLAGRLQLALPEIESMIEAGLLRCEGSGRSRLIPGEDIPLAEGAAALAATGISAQSGYDPRDWSIYLRMVNWLASEELRIFTAHMPPTTSREALTETAERAVEILNNMLGHLHTRALLQAIRTKAGSTDESL